MTNFDLQQIIVDLDRRWAEAERAHQTSRLAPWVMVLLGASAGPTFFAADAVAFKLLAKPC